MITTGKAQPYGGKQSRKIRTTLLILGLMVLGLLGGLVVLAILFGKGTPKPLSAVELKFVGVWKQKGENGDGDGHPFTLSSKRELHTHKGEYEGRWWVENNQFRMKYWRNSDSYVPFMGLIHDFQSPTESWDFTIDDANGHLVLKEPGKDIQLIWVPVEPENDEPENDATSENP